MRDAARRGAAGKGRNWDTGVERERMRGREDLKTIIFNFFTLPLSYDSPLIFPSSPDSSPSLSISVCRAPRSLHIERERIDF